MTDHQLKLTTALDTQRADIVRALRKMADMFGDEMNGPQAMAVSWVYRAAADLVNSVNWAQMAEVAKVTVRDGDETNA
jgi:hypothetical protein